MEGSTKILGYNSGSYPILDENPTNKYAACTLTVTEEGSKWEGPKDVSFTVQSPQLVTYLRTYYMRNITVTIDENDAGTENAKSFGTVLNICVIPFIIPDACKMALAYIMGGLVKKAVR
jgi:hypothetical protein